MKRLLVGGGAALGAAALIALPLSAMAQEDEDGGWLDDTLSGLVEDGTLTQAQADTVEQALRDNRPTFEHHGRGGPGGHFIGPGGFDEAATAIGITEDVLHEALRDGQTIAEVASANGVEVQAVIDAMVAAAEERIDAAVTDGRLDEAEAAERKAELTEMITSLVNGELPMRGERPADLPPPPTEEEAPAPPTTTD